VVVEAYRVTALRESMLQGHVFEKVIKSAAQSLWAECNRHLVSGLVRSFQGSVEDRISELASMGMYPFVYGVILEP
jgi:hypothetical protein